MNDRAGSITTWIVRHAVFVWIGIALNLAFCVTLILDPATLFEAFGVPVTETVWPRFSGLLLLILSVFYIPATINFRRYELFAWLAVFPARTFGVVFFVIAVFVFGQPLPFLLGAAIDGFVALTTLYCLVKIGAIEQEQAALGAAA